jgi:peptidoglycan/xylan/chitin deacetylase (PgdA/CDA1 family)
MTKDQKEELQPWEWPEKKWRSVVGKVRAGRSLKPKAWPNGARVAVALSFDSDHESIVLRQADESPGKLSQGHYGARVGVPRIQRLLDKYGIKVTFFVPAVIAQLYPEQQRELIQSGHEIAIHGWIHEINSELPPEVERNLQMRAADVLEEITHTRPVGIRTPSWEFSPVTLKISREMGLLYDSSLMADDDPYEILDEGEPTGIVELPVEWIRDDAVYFNMNRFSGLRPYTPPTAVFDIFKREFDGAYEEGGLFLLTNHPHEIGHRSRIWIVEELILHIQGHEGVWFATHEEIARYCLENA